MSERTVDSLRAESKISYLGTMPVDDWQEKWRLDVEFLLAEIDRLLALREEEADRHVDAVRERDRALALVKKLQQLIESASI